MLFRPDDGGCVLDIGANDGRYAEEWAQQVGTEGVVWAVEPHPEAFLAAKRRTLSYPQVLVIRYAAGNPDTASGDGTCEMFGDMGDTRRSSLWRENLVGEAMAFKAPLVSVDTLVSWMPRTPDWIKVDTQGAEGVILLGALATLDAMVSRWCVELWPEGLRHAGSSVEDVAHMFQRRGYTAMLSGKPATWPQVVDAANRKTGHGSIDVLCYPPTPEAA